MVVTEWKEWSQSAKNHRSWYNYSTAH